MASPHHRFASLRGGHVHQAAEPAIGQLQFTRLPNQCCRAMEHRYLDFRFGGIRVGRAASMARRLHPRTYRCGAATQHDGPKGAAVKKGWSNRKRCVAKKRRPDIRTNGRRFSGGPFGGGNRTGGGPRGRDGRSGDNRGGYGSRSGSGSSGSSAGSSYSRDSQSKGRGDSRGDSRRPRYSSDDSSSN